MPQLSPMLGFFMFAVVLFAYIVLVCGMSKKIPFVHLTKPSKNEKISLPLFN